ncbi:DUF4269 domain-containing protein [Bacillus sp. DJP31]|uniref:DUF4269 domain-containing protein n=1 Tax=Bacillus sp. DJP31 TaxID=3409789 RepID=UPI003BB665FE
MFNSLVILKLGNEKHKKAYKALVTLGILKDLARYAPVLCGTFPLGIDIEGSDLDIIMNVKDFNEFEQKVHMLYGNLDSFKQNRLTIRDKAVSKANFLYDGFEFELFGKSQPVERQYAYLHMVIENYILKDSPHLREEVINLKNQGRSYEPPWI